jgi:hypothetical protein
MHASGVLGSPGRPIYRTLLFISDISDSPLQDECFWCTWESRASDISDSPLHIGVCQYIARSPTLIALLVTGIRYISHYATDIDTGGQQASRPALLLAVY